MSSNNTFNFKRFGLLFKQHFIHNTRLLLFATIAYVGVIFILLSIVQIGNDRMPHELDSFRGFLLGFVTVFGILYSGYSFPAFRNKESTINYLMVPASTIEKFLFELISRIGLILLLLPLLFWVTFHLQGYFFNLFSEASFAPIAFSEAIEIPVGEQVKGYYAWVKTMLVSLVVLGLVCAFTGSAMFNKQPLVKTLFSVATLVIFYSLVIYVAFEHFGITDYNPNESVWLIPADGVKAFKFFAILIIITNLVLLFVAYLKLKEKEV